MLDKGLASYPGLSYCSDALHRHFVMYFMIAVGVKQVIQEQFGDFSRRKQGGSPLAGVKPA